MLRFTVNAIAMRYLLLILFSSALCTPLAASAQSSVVYGFAGDDEGYQVIPTRDGGFMVGGNSSKKGNQDYWVVKFSAKGQVVWDSVYGTTKFENLWSIQPANDGGALIAGFSGTQNSGTESALMYKLDSVGRVERSKDVDYAFADHAHWFAQMPDGRFYWAGHTDSKGDRQGDMILQKLDSGMNTIWEKTYGLGSSEHAHCGALTKDGGCVLLGHTSISGYEHFWAIRLDSGGKQVWSKVFKTSDTVSDSPYGIIATKEGGFALIGGTSQSVDPVGQMWLVIVDSAGNKIVDKHYGRGDAFAWNGTQTSDSGYLLAGSTNIGTAGGYDMSVVRTDSKGNVLWTKNYGSALDDIGFAAFQHGSKFVVVGATYNTIDSLGDLYVVYIDSVGNPTTYANPASVAPVSIEQFSAGLLVSPNPASPVDRTLLLTFANTATQKISKLLQVEVVNEVGAVVEVVLPHLRQVVSGALAASVPISALPMGSYFARVSALDAAGSPISFSTKFVLQPR